MTGRFGCWISPLSNLLPATITDKHHNTPPSDGHDYKRTIIQIQAAAITIPMQASDDNHLFGSVTERIIAETLAAQGIVVDVHKIHLDGQIRMLGEFTVVIRILRDISATAKINVVRA